MQRTFRSLEVPEVPRRYSGIGTSSGGRCMPPDSPFLARSSARIAGRSPRSFSASGETNPGLSSSTESAGGPLEDLKRKANASTALILGCIEARYRNQMKPDSFWKSLDEIYQINIPLHLFYKKQIVTSFTIFSRFFKKTCVNQRA